MSQMLQLKKDPAWLKFFPFNAGTVILLQGDDPDCQVSVPADLLIAISPLVRNILSAGHLPPVFSTPAISFPSVSVDILETVGEMLVSGNASMDMTRLSGVREVFMMMVIEDWMFVQTEKEVKYLENEDTVRDLDKEKCKLDLENVKFEITIKLEKESDSSSIRQQVNPVSLVLNGIKEKNQTISKEPLKKHLPPRTARLKNAGNLEEELFEKSSGQKEKLKKRKNFSSNIIEDKYSRKIKKSCPHCEKNMVGYQLNRHIKSVHNKETVQCPQCNKTLGIRSLSIHNRSVHNKETVQCPHCKKTLAIRALSMHIRLVHNKETVQCQHCKKTLAINALSRHNRSVHNKETVQCPNCKKTLPIRALSMHIRSVHNKETVQCPQCNKTLGIAALSGHIRIVHKKDKKDQKEMPSV